MGYSKEMSTYNRQHMPASMGATQNLMIVSDQQRKTRVLRRNLHF